MNKLAVFHDGGHMANISAVMEIETADIGPIAQMLIDVGMAEDMSYNYLRLDPALPAYLKLGQSNETLNELVALWADAMKQLVGLLYEQTTKDSTMAAQLTLLELPNLLALLNNLLIQVEVDQTLAESVSDTVGSIEQLFANLGRPQALAKAVNMRGKIVKYILEWGRARFERERMLIERLQQQGQLQLAFEKAQALLTQVKNKGTVAYQGVDSDLAMANALLGRVLCYGGQTAPAIIYLITAQQLYEALSSEGKRMAAEQ